MAAKTRDDDAVTADTAVDRRVESGDHSQKELDAEEGRGEKAKGLRYRRATATYALVACASHFLVVALEAVGVTPPPSTSGTAWERTHKPTASDFPAVV